MYRWIYKIQFLKKGLNNIIHVRYLNFFKAEPSVQVDDKPKCCSFKISPKMQFNKVVKAHLWIYLRPVRQTTTVFMQILRLKPVGQEWTNHTPIRSLKFDINSGTGHWQSIDFKRVLQNWLKQPESNWGIQINASDINGLDLAITSPGVGEEGLVSGILFEQYI